VPLDAVPSLVFSEIMRDVDLFVGIVGIGNDPTWSDGGPDGRFREDWTRAATSELAVTAATRREVLEQLIPRLRIAERCELDDRHLIVRGDLATYKIHLGSANILMEPGGRFLCIVPKTSDSRLERLRLPFEGDRILSIILSKAFLLAADTGIKDPSIRAQIGEA